MNDGPQPGETDEEFLDRVDPYGDRFGTAIPWWGCLLLVFAVTAIIYTAYRLLIWFGVAFSIGV